MESPRPSRKWARGSSIGRGTFGTVSLAGDKSNGQIFAVKSVDLNYSPLPSIAALENEIRILKSLDSPYIVSYLGDDTTRESPAGTFRNLHVEYMPGGTVADAAAGKSPIDELDLRAYTSCVARALHYLHTVAGVVHGDVKGRNVLLGSDSGVAKLSDFGSARRVCDGGAERCARGTPLWMAPEVVRGEDPTTAADVWSLGCTVIEMASGGHPWPSGDAPAALLRIGFGDEVPEFPARLSKTAWDFLDKCLRRDASERWTSEQLLRHPFLADGGGGTGPSPRCVLNWGNSGFDMEDSDGDQEEYYSDRTVDSWRERIKGLCSDGGMVGWESDGWEMIRWVGEVGPNLGAVAGGGQGTRREYSNCCGGELGSYDGGDVSLASGTALSNGMRCSGCSCYNGGLGCQKEVGIRAGLFFSWYKMLFRFTVVNAYTHLLYFS